MEWTAELSVGFVSLPPEKEEAYWAAIHILAEIMFEEFYPHPALPQIEEHDLGEEEQAVNVEESLEEEYIQTSYLSELGEP